MIIIWILLGIIAYFGPIVLMFWSYSLELKDRRSKVTIGDVWDVLEEEIIAFTFFPGIGFFFGIWFIIKAIAYKFKDIEI